MKNKCDVCNKKLKLGFNLLCKCGKTTCLNHRYPEHDCNFDYKTHERDALTKANPVISTPK